MVCKSRWAPEDKDSHRDGVDQHLGVDSGALQEAWRRAQHVHQWKERFLEAGKLGLSGGLRNGDASGELENENERPPRSSSGS